MAIRPKTRRRVLILLLAFIVLAGAGTGFFLFRKHQIHQDLLAKRDKGMAAAETGDYYTALHSIGSYLNRYPEDAEAVYTYALARQEVVEPNGEHLRQAAAFFRRALELTPNHPEARKHLLELYSRIGFHTEGLALANRQLERNPDNLAAVRAKALALTGLRKFKEARPVAERYAAAEPTDLDGHTLVFRIYRSLDQPDEAFLAYAAEAANRLDDAPLAPLLRAMAHLQVNNREQALDWANTAANLEPPDSDYARHVASIFDTLGEHRRASAYLEDAAGNDRSTALLKPLAHRLWQTGRVNDLLERLAIVDPASEDADSGLLGLKALVLLSQGRAEDAAPIVEQLKSREGDHVAAGWHAFLTASKPGEQRTPEELIDACDEALSYLPGNPYIRFAKGNSFGSLQEYELAINEWRNAAQRAPAWPKPVLRIADALLETDRPRQAYQAARAALERAPNSIAAALTLSESLHRLLPSADDNMADRLMQLVEQIQTTVPGEPRTAMIRIDLLARRGERQQAIDAARKLLDADRGLPADRLLQLAETSRRHDLGLASDCFAQIEDRFGQSPSLVYARAIQRAQVGHAAEGRELLKTAVESAPQGQRLAYGIARARFLAQTNHPDATGAWRELADAHPQNRDIQRRALEADASWRDLDFVSRVIDRLAPEDGDPPSLRLQIARARYLLQSDASPHAASKASQILTQAIATAPAAYEARLLAVEAFRRQGNTSAAMKELTAAVNLKPSARGPQLEMARILIERGDDRRAANILEQIATAPDLSRDLKRRAAALFGRLGKVNRAIYLVVDANGGRADAPDLILASLYRRANRMDSAEAVCDALLEEAPSASAVEFTADLLAADDRMDEARAVLDKLDELDLEPGLAKLIRGGFAARHDGPQQAVAAFRKAASQAPDNPRAWSLLLTQHIQLGHVDPTLQTVAQASEALPDNAVFELLREHRDLLSFAVDRPILRPLAAALVRRPDYQQACIAALRILNDTTDDSPRAADQIIRISQLADRHRRFLPLQSLLARLHMQLDQPEKAADVASRAMRAFPNASEPAWMAAEALAAAGRWSEALGVSEEWRNRSANRPLAADMMIAEARMQLGETGSAVAQLAPHLEKALADPDAHVPFIVKHARAQIVDGDIERATQILQPLLDRSAMWRTIWIRLAYLVLPEVESARAWLERVNDSIPADALEEHVELARAWRALDERFEAPEHSAQARKLLNHVTRRDDPPAQAFSILGMMDEADGDLEAAERHYRRALQINPEIPLAANNLAMILINRKQDLDDALRFAKTAVEVAPRVAPFHDTYALALINNGQPEEAVRQQARAVELAPNDATFTINLAYILARAERFDDAAKLLDRLDEAIADPSELPEALKRTLDAARRLVADHRPARDADADAT